MSLAERIAKLRSLIADLEAREAKRPCWKNRDSLWQLRLALKDAEKEQESN